MKSKKKMRYFQSKKSYSKLAIASFLVSVLGLLIPSFISVYLSLVAFILGIFALRTIKTEKVRGKLFAWIGISIVLFQALLLIIGLGYAIFILRGSALRYSCDKRDE